MRPLWKTTIVIWSEEDPSGRMELEDLAREATRGAAYCSQQGSIYVTYPEDDPGWDGTEFFDAYQPLAVLEAARDRETT